MRWAVCIVAAAALHLGLVWVFRPEPVVVLAPGAGVEVEFGRSDASTDADVAGLDATTAPDAVGDGQESPEPLAPREEQAPSEPTTDAEEEAQPDRSQEAPASSDPTSEPDPSDPDPAVAEPPPPDPTEARTPDAAEPEDPVEPIEQTEPIESAKPAETDEPTPEIDQPATPDPASTANDIPSPSTPLEAGALDAPVSTASPSEDVGSASADVGQDGSVDGVDNSVASAAAAALAGNSDSANYAGIVMQHLSRIRRPRAERAGSAYIKFVISTDGQIETAAVSRS
ncbi:MAG: hypothetical protein AAGB25_06235, partial [Pseudomonadota bacterium]